MRNSQRMTHSARSLGALVILGLALAVSGCTPGSPTDADSTATPTPSAVTSSEPIESTDPGSEVAFQMHDKYTKYEDGPGVVIIVGQAVTGVFRPGDGLELLGGGPDTGTVILEIRQGAPSVAVDSLPAGEFGEFLVTGSLDDFDFIEEFVRPTE
ncbi:Lipoprotein [Salinibacterium sp. NYA9b]